MRMMGMGMSNYEMRMSMGCYADDNDDNNDDGGGGGCAVLFLLPDGENRTSAAGQLRAN